MKEIDLLIALQKADTDRTMVEKKKDVLPQEISALQRALDKHQQAYKELTQKIADHKIQASTFALEAKKRQAVLKEKREHLKVIRSSKEYDLYQKGIALEEIEYKLAQKKLKEAQVSVKEYTPLLEKIDKEMEEERVLIASKRERFDEQLPHIEQELAALEQKRAVLTQDMPSTLYQNYDRIARNLDPQPAVTHVEANACNNCHITLPLQRKVDIKEKKRIISCEHCGSILAHVVEEEVLPTKPVGRTKRERRPLGTATS